MTKFSFILALAVVTFLTGLFTFYNSWLKNDVEDYKRKNLRSTGIFFMAIFLSVINFYLQLNTALGQQKTAILLNTIIQKQDLLLKANGFLPDSLKAIKKTR